METLEGRAAYEGEQRAFSLRAAPIRQSLIALCDEILASCCEFV
jgi:hypothetical protein